MTDYPASCDHTAVAPTDTSLQTTPSIEAAMGSGGASRGRFKPELSAANAVADLLFAQQYLTGDIDVEFTPQGTLAERLRAGGAGIAGFYTRTGVGTHLAAGKPVAAFDGETYLLERGIVADLALVHAHRSDRHGNVTYRHTARNSNPLVATAGRITIAEVEILSDEPLDPNVVVTPGIYVDRLVIARPRNPDIEQRTTNHPAI